ncbi:MULTISPECIES: preprotein translocase subunit SecE [Exiguobacterium]|jgi:preprotein translocase subunit SecE|uniref:Protein translocase subunit SecE n=2 Tax=Exiguobacterium TaxID=33986 RepID=B1YGT5_EXIS2|nr:MULTISPECIES: preprotein translocase subunit SecE [Exiguobacterium]ACB59568.1 preprotein translocase, SecE subunit [Exiguobacterium sibiricum 255-15]MCT4791191.1 preprotein translocase subunit SecE [Exiguobacterium artemiae]MDW2886835.1 preprotein translocase subunit SecE [Exiguobacterium sibiricum]MDX1261077.1 preprotein translocase subunit SecE [Exiguobacterium sp. K1]OAN10068.1 preprotein translocase subunit SecE [Exiguobacterium undae]
MKFLRDVWNELKKTSWPKRKELTKYTLTVIGMVIFMGVFIFGVDSGLSAFMSWLIK